ncbi:MAG TPA: glycosyltransferase family 4 protein [Caldilineaceae bacterium]|nr:glycosyltransferase family 4 protein [Caldilineaceae bacterium]
MRILVAHNFYQQPGGEDTTRTAEIALLRGYGHEVYEYIETNQRIEQMSPVSVAFQTIWSLPSYQRIRQTLAECKPDIVHFHNTFPLISPAGYHACRAVGVPVVQTIHNFRVTCLSATFTRDGRVCEDCLGKRIPWPGILHRCYHGSLTHSAVVAGYLVTHHTLRTWRQQVDAYIVLTEFAKAKLVQAGLPAHKLHIKPQCIFPDPGARPAMAGDYALYVGRLSPEKGLPTLLRAWAQVPAEIPLKIVGDGPLKQSLQELAQRLKLRNVEFVGQVDRSVVLKLMKQARLLVFPSECYEGYPLTITEALACGLPVLASRLGAMATILRDGDTGLLFAPGDAEDLAAQVQWAWTHPDDLLRISQNGRAQYENENSPEKNYLILMDIYRAAGQARAARQ